MGLGRRKRRGTLVKSSQVVGLRDRLTSVIKFYDNNVSQAKLGICTVVACVECRCSRDDSSRTGKVGCRCSEGMNCRSSYVECRSGSQG